MAYTYDNKGIYSAKVSGAWKKVALWTSGDQVELLGTGNTNLPNSMGAAVSLADLIVAMNGAIGTANGFATLGGDTKLLASQMPASVAGGLSYTGTVNGGVANLDSAFTPALTGDETDKSKYWVVTVAGVLANGSTITWETNAYDDGEAAAGATLEVGDLLLCTGDGKMTVLSNSYGDASTTVKGVVTLADAATRAALSGNAVVTEGILATILNDDVLVDGDFATAGYMKSNGAGGYSIDNNTFLTSETSHADVLVDSEFASAGLMVTDGSGGYSIDSNDYQRKITVSASAASGGEDNDIWIQTS